MPPSARKRRSRSQARLGSSTPGLPMTPPGGMRDLLPPASMTRTLLWQRLMETFDLYGYQRVTTPPVEYAEVIERGLGTVDRRDLVRFVEPDSGEVALLRPDITPQIARIVATRLQDRPAPWRLCYEGTIVAAPTWPCAQATSGSAVRYRMCRVEGARSRCRGHRSRRSRM